MNELKKHSGGCHCGNVRYEVTADLSSPVLACNCSICSRSGTWLTFVPTEQFSLLSGADVLSDYQFGKKRIHHLFCRTCGIRSFARAVAPDGRAMIAVNARCLDEVDLEKLSLKHFDGKSL